MVTTAIHQRLIDFLVSEAKSCSMDFGCVTPQYVYRMWGGVLPLKILRQD